MIPPFPIGQSVVNKRCTTSSSAVLIYFYDNIFGNFLGAKKEL